MPSTLVLKLVLTPVLIAAASLAGRRWGPGLSGWLVGLPLTSGPVVFFLALEQGNRFAAAAAVGVSLGVTSQAVFGLAYVHLGGRLGWPAGLLSGAVTYGLATMLFDLVRLPTILGPMLVCISLLIAIRLLPPEAMSGSATTAADALDLPLRIVIATSLVVALTTIAPGLGPHLSGLISPFPLYAAILAVFAQRRSGLAGAAAVWRGLSFGLFAFLGFFSVLATCLVRFGIVVSFALAISVAVAIQSATLILMRLPPRSVT